MFFLSLDNQIHLLIIVIFSSYIYLSSLVLKQEAPFIKHFGTAFFIPLILCILSFFSINSELSASYLFFAEFIFISGLILILLLQRNKDLTNMIIILLYALPLGMAILNLNFDSLHRSLIFDLIITLYICAFVIVIISSFWAKRYSRLSMYWGILMICSSMLIVRLHSSDTATSTAFIVKGAGYILFFIFYYRTTVYKLEKSHIKKSAQLKRINESVQREVNRRVEAIERSNRKLVEISKTDDLTGAYTKKAILDMIANRIDKNPNSEFSILMFDIDSFKEINDSHGHIAGDKCIKTLVNIAKSSLRCDDKLGRYGGDEFFVLLPDTSPVKAYLAAERFRKNVDRTNNPHFTISIGVASYPLDATNTRALISAVDKALYISKKNGRNTVTHVSQTER